MCCASRPSNRPVAAKIFGAQQRHFATTILNGTERHCSGSIGVELHIGNEPIVAAFPVWQVAASIPNGPGSATVGRYGVHPSHENERSPIINEPDAVTWYRNRVIMSKRHKVAPGTGALGSGTKNIIGPRQKAVLFRMGLDAYLKRLSRSFPRFDNWPLIWTNYQHRYEAPIEHDDDANYDHEHTGDDEDSSLHSEITRRTTVELTRRRESKHSSPHQESYETRPRRSRPTSCWVHPVNERVSGRKNQPSAVATAVRQPVPTGTVHPQSFRDDHHRQR